MIILIIHIIMLIALIIFGIAHIHSMNKILEDIRKENSKNERF